MDDGIPCSYYRKPFLSTYPYEFTLWLGYTITIGMGIDLIYFDKNSVRLMKAITGPIQYLLNTNSYWRQ